MDGYENANRTYDNANRVGSEAMNNALKSMSIMTKGFQQIANETGEFTKRSVEQSAQMFEKFSQVRTLDKAVELQTEFARTVYENWMSQANKMAGLYSDLARDAYKPFEATGYAAAQAAKDEARQAG
ncbi:phasin family protein [Aureimonas sp. AU4]|uniref:phasin family protein n=1 Tax=Aureimonas sp. AU4 TaxID=1638163 RepID=UPI000782A9BF|nr:phasin family protein [Aureimonas sp. AU4]